MIKKLSIVYDITKMCPWGCKICCMCASKEKSDEELNLNEKLKIIENIYIAVQLRDIHIDFSGGEIFTNVDENMKVIKYASELFGRENIGISTSGYKINNDLAQQLSKYISECEMTIDTIPEMEYPLRPIGYAKAASTAIKPLKEYNIKIGIQSVLTHSNCNKKVLKEIYDFICKEKVDCWSLLKFYPSGYGKKYQSERLNIQQEQWTVKFIKQLDDNNSSPNKPCIDFHYRIKGHDKFSTECRCVKKSIGILPNGDVTSCFWAINEYGNIADNKYYLGNLRKQSLVSILNNEK